MSALAGKNDASALIICYDVLTMADQLPGLLLVDVQQGFDDPRWGERNNPEAEAAIASVLAAWRRARAPLVHVRHRSGPDGVFQPGSAAFEFKPEATPLAGEPVVEKSVNAAFIGTDLEHRLRRDGVDEVLIVGFTTDHCCSTTARMAANLGFTTYFCADATATFARHMPTGETFAADLMHRTALASLSGEFAAIIDVERAVALVEP